MINDALDGNVGDQAPSLLFPSPAAFIRAWVALIVLLAAGVVALHWWAPGLVR